MPPEFFNLCVAPALRLEPVVWLAPLPFMNGRNIFRPLDSETEHTGVGTNTHPLVQKNNKRAF
jgi:hypothetical protein